MNDKYKTAAAAALDYMALNNLTDDGGTVARAVRCLQPPPQVPLDRVLTFYTALNEGNDSVPDLGLSKSYRSSVFSTQTYPVYTLLAALSSSAGTVGRKVAKSLLPLFDEACAVGTSDPGTGTLYRHCLSVRDVLIHVLNANTSPPSVKAVEGNYKKFHCELADLVSNADVADVDDGIDKQACTIGLLMGDRKFGVAETHRSADASFKQAPKLDVEAARRAFYGEGGANYQVITNFQDVFLLERSARADGKETITARGAYCYNPEYRTHESLLRDSTTIANTDSPSDPTALPAEFICAATSLLIGRLRDRRLHGWLALRLLCLMATDRLKTLKHAHCLNDALAAMQGVWLTADGYLVYVVENMADTAIRHHMIVRLNQELALILIESLTIKPASYWVDRLSRHGNKVASFAATPILLVRASDKWHSLSTNGLDHVHRGLLKGELASDRKTRMTYVELPHAHLQQNLAAATAAYRKDVLGADIGPPSKAYSAFHAFFDLPSCSAAGSIGGDIWSREQAIKDLAEKRSSTLLRTRAKAIRRLAPPEDIVLRLNAAVDDAMARTASAHGLRPFNKITELHLVIAFASYFLRVFEKRTGTAVETHLTPWNFDAAGFNPDDFLRDWVTGVHKLLSLKVKLSVRLARQHQSLQTFLHSKTPIRACSFLFSSLVFDRQTMTLDIGDLPRFVPAGYDIPANTHRALSLTQSALRQEDALNAAVAGHECTLSLCDPLSSTPVTALRPLQLAKPTRRLPRLWEKYS